MARDRLCPAVPEIPDGEVRAWRSDFLAWLESLREDGAAKPSGPRALTQHSAST